MFACFPDSRFFRSFFDTGKIARQPSGRQWWKGLVVAFTSSTPRPTPGVSRTSRGVRIVSNKRDGLSENCKTALNQRFFFIVFEKNPLYEKRRTTYSDTATPSPPGTLPWSAVVAPLHWLVVSGLLRWPIAVEFSPRRHQSGAKPRIVKGPHLQISRLSSHSPPTLGKLAGHAAGDLGECRLFHPSEMEGDPRSPSIRLQRCGG